MIPTVGFYELPLTYDYPREDKEMLPRMDSNHE